TYTFTLTATDATCSSNTANLIFQVQVTASGGGAPGTIGGVVDLLEFDTGNGANPDIIPVGNNIYAIAYTGPNGDGYLATVQIDASGQIANAVIDTLEFDFSNGDDPDITQVDGNIFAIAYTGPGNDGYVATVQIGADGQIGNAPLDTLEFETGYCYEPDILAIGPNLFAIAYTGPDNDGFITTVQIAADGQIANSVVDTIEFNSSQAYEADLIHIAGDIYAVAYAGAGMISDGYVSTVAIDSSGQINDAVLDNLEFDPSLCYDPDIVHVSGDIYAVAYRGPGDDGFIRTLQIAPDGTISNTTIDVLEFDPVQCNEPVISNVGGGVFLIAYRGQSNDGFLASVQIDETGQIGNAVLDSLEFAATDGNEPSIVSLGGGMFAVCYRGPNDDGFVVTVSMQ
ncbi:MAG: hypothetical protein AB1772_13470, partial [Candidatus Zixiibacteriota bacterium]